MSDLISVVVPVYNGQNSLEEIYKRLQAVMRKNKLEFELIFIDDNSPDQSFKKILELNSFDQRVKGIRLAQNFGQQNAIFCGFNYAEGDYIITMDDDLEHQPEVIIKLYEKIKEGYDAVYAIPQNREYSFYRRIGSKLTNKLFNLITPKSEELRVSSFRIITRELLNKIINVDKSFIYISAVILKERAEIANIYIDQGERKHGDSNYNFLKLLRLFFKLYIYYGSLAILKFLRSKKEQYIIKESTYHKN